MASLTGIFTAASNAISELYSALGGVIGRLDGGDVVAVAAINKQWRLLDKRTRNASKLADKSFVSCGC